ncbi:thioredoxin fold domain-containing protein [Tropicimonas sp. IMCC6043]|uniref:thioredoxin fold domain-containing protein n=1 Tax=Tropicimonas sp. IMCC6043 TaxID=2510645 RepID=UPI00101DE8B2|nr:thioredoxin fold domain-containing protein [Tropicimonas sp. IMCC6043]RYH10588.1 thioredoxin family protein [Tropicimonas sp. IMCC6043]
MSLTAFAAGAVELVMVEQHGCVYCTRWNAEIGPIYPKTSEGAYAPLRRVELGSEAMNALSLKRRVSFTPTFVLVDDASVELARLEGYPGEDFFWGLLGKMLSDVTDFQPLDQGGS